jgi:predicted phosphodiesterase
MKIGLVSDLHLEFGNPLHLDNYCSEIDVLIVAGDVCEVKNVHLFRDFFTDVSFSFPHVVYVAGNHEFYTGEMQETKLTIRETLARFSNVYFLDNEVKEIDGVRFLGSTLWTDFNKGDPISMWQIAQKINDYRIIRNRDFSSDVPRRLLPEDTAQYHMVAKEFIMNELSESFEKTVVVTHMAPSEKSVHSKYKNDYHVNGAYFSNLESLIEENKHIKLWCHGHTHDHHDYMIEHTRVVCNPRGYKGYELTANNFNYKILEI